MQTKEIKLIEREKNCQEFETSFEKTNQALEQAKKTVKDYSTALSHKNAELREMAVELKDIQENRDSLIQKYDLLKKIARNDCYLIKDFAVAMKMLIFSENSPYKANLTEEQANLIKSIINIAKELLKKRSMPQSVKDIETKCEISSLILNEIKKLTPQNQPMFSIDRIKSDEFKPTSEANPRNKPIYRGR